MNLDRRKLPDSDFALPNRRMYPIPDQLHAHLAIDEAKKWASVAERKKIAKAISKRYPDLKPEASGLAAMQDGPPPEPSASRRTYRNNSTPGMDKIVTGR
ncbi:MAG: hypothetical protein JO307_26750 [Bryobacterales bacterium]|nr:hypothetical protein [Bryobacterales bacterium]MBV9399661.1 hypothetical protein [Bryobacterales bacterium]